MKWRDQCNLLLKEIEKCVVVPKNCELTAAEYLKSPITFMENLIHISELLIETKPDKYNEVLQRLLEEQDKNLSEIDKIHGIAYVPLLKNNKSPDKHVVVRIPKGEAFPIPTYGRVLFYFWIEVVDMPEKKKKKKKEEKIIELTTTSEE